MAGTPKGPEGGRISGHIIQNGKGGGVVKKQRIGNGSEGSARGSVSQGQLPQLTETERDIYHLWAEEFQTPLQIALRRQISDRAVRKHIQNIKSKGYVLNMVPGVPNLGPTSEPSLEGKGPRIRLHAQHFVVKLLHKTPAYDAARARGNVQYLQDCTVRLHKESIEVIASSGLSFLGGSADKATAESMEFWTRVFHRLESHLGVVLLKARAQNIRQVGAHYARINCGLAKEVLDAGDRVRVYAREDGKLWFTIDDSFNLNESETLHPETAGRDMADVVEPHLNDWRAHGRALWPQSELQRALQDIIARDQAERAINADLLAVVQAVAQSQVVTQQQVQILATTLGAVLGAQPRKSEDEKPTIEVRPPYVG